MKYLLLGIIITQLMSCSYASETPSGTLEWDFDHKLQFRKTQIDERHFHLEIIRMPKTKFSQLSVFLLRKSQALCGEYGYQITMLSGVEGFLDKKALPNYIQGNLIAEVACKKG
tara:strand:- start:1145 stop:1486 length:342 start_codon:yes stop_codon:yes gene_type:complete